MKILKILFFSLSICALTISNSIGKEHLISLGQHLTNDKIKSRNLTVSLNDSTDSNFNPELKLTAWRGECKFIVKLQSKTLAKSKSFFQKLTFSNAKSKYQLVGTDFTHEFYKRADGNFEWEIILKRKPKSNELIFDIQTSGLTYYFQPPLTADEFEAGHHRPDSIVGSYAVYHSTKRNNFKTINGKSLNYSTGKAFHIYRPKAYDITGDFVWLDMEIDTINAILKIIIDSTWIKSANFPITIDPTIGRTDIGGSDFTWTSSLFHNKYIMYDSSKYTIAENGTLQTAYIALKTTAGTKTDSLSLVIYNWNATLSQCNLIDSVTWEITHNNTSYDWFSNSGLSTILYTDSTYVVGVSGKGESSGNLRYAYDLGAWASTKYKTGSDFSWPSTLSGFSNTSGYFISAYASFITDSPSNENLGRRKKVIH